MFFKKNKTVWWVLEYAVYKRQLPVAMAKGCLEIPTQGRANPGPKRLSRHVSSCPEGPEVQWSGLLCSGVKGPVGPPLETSLRCGCCPGWPRVLPVLFPLADYRGNKLEALSPVTW